MNIKIRPEFYALFAAIVNATIGPLNRFAFNEGQLTNKLLFINVFWHFLFYLYFALRRKNCVTSYLHWLSKLSSSQF